MLICIGVGIWALRRTKSTHDFFMAGRDLGVMVTAFAVFSSTLSGFGFVGGPGLVYKMGMSSVWMIVCVIMGYNISFMLLAKRLRLFSELGNSLSLPDVVFLRYGKRSTSAFVAVAIILGVLGYLATQILAMAVVLKDILVETDFLSTISLEMCVLISCSILVFYSVTGGIVASVYSDLIQGGVMVVAATLVFITVVYTFDNGFSEISQTIQEHDPEAIGPWGTLGMVGCLSWFFVFGLGSSGQPHVITKMMMYKKVSDAKFILPVSTIGYLFSALLWIGIGLAMRALVLQGIQPELETADAAASQFLQNYAHPVLAGVVFAGLFAAIMSTADAFLNIGTAAVMHDIPKGLKGMKEEVDGINRRIKNTPKWVLFFILLSLISFSIRLVKLTENYNSALLLWGIIGLLFLFIKSFNTMAKIFNRMNEFLPEILKNDLFLARFVTFLITIFSAVFALYSGDLVAILGAFGWGTFAAAIVPVVVIGFNWKRATPMAANVAVISSLVVNFVIKIFKISVPYNIDVGALALTVSLILFIGISLASEQP